MIKPSFVRPLAAVCCLLALLAAPAARAQESEKYDAMPEALVITQRTARTNLKNNRYVAVTYPDTVCDDADDALRAQIDAWAALYQELIPTPSDPDRPSYLDVGAQVFRTGTSWASFLVIAHIAHDMDQVFVRATTQVYDLATGERLTLGDVFPDGSAAWALLAQAVREQLTAYFPGETPDAAALDALCSRESLENADFTLSAMRLSLHYEAAALYPDKTTLMHVHVYYPSLAGMMTERAAAQTDNSRYRMAALTFDDGPTRGSSMDVVKALRNTGASATFFLVGKNYYKGMDIIKREHDAGHAVASHNYYHESSRLTYEQVHEWKALFDEMLVDLIGLKAPYMRAPGGLEKWFVIHEVGLPLIRWSLISGDASGGVPDVKKVANKVIAGTSDGGIVLMHDSKSTAGDYAQRICEGLHAKGFLLVTVDELFARDGVTLQPNQVYHCCENGVTVR